MEKESESPELRFGRRLRELRTQAELSQEQLAFKAGVDRSFVGQVERGERNLSLLNIYKLALGLDVQAYRLLQGSDDCDDGKAA